jgi:hypothetical protein
VKKLQAAKSDGCIADHHTATRDVTDDYCEAVRLEIRAGDNVAARSSFAHWP